MNRILVATLSSFALFTVIAARVTDEDLPWLDARILRLVPRYNEPNSFSRLCDAYITAGMAFVVIAVAVTAVLLVLRRSWRAAVFWCLTFVGLYALDRALKPVFERPSIDGSGEYSFPSGNAMASMAILIGGAALVAGIPRRVYVLGGALVAAYGAALVYISWHYPFDVIGGWLLAIAWIGFLSLVIRPPTVVEARRLRLGRASHPRLGTQNRARVKYASAGNQPSCEPYSSITAIPISAEMSWLPGSRRSRPSPGSSSSESPRHGA